jgi:hypothetical protein
MVLRRPSKRRLLQFSLRTFLVLLTAGCIWLGLKTERVRIQRRTVRLVKSCGGEPIYDYQYTYDPIRPGMLPTPPGPKPLRLLLGEDYFADLVWIEVANIADADLRWISEQKTLRRLSVSGGFSDEGLKAVSRLSELEVLEISGGRFSGSGLDRLSSLSRLRMLSLNDLSLSDEATRSIGRLSMLESLSLANSRTGSKQTQHLKGLDHLTSLDLGGTQVGDEGLMVLAELNALRTLRLSGSMVSHKGIAKLQAALPDLQIEHSIAVGRDFSTRTSHDRPSACPLPAPMVPGVARGRGSPAS